MGIIAKYIGSDEVAAKSLRAELDELSAALAGKGITWREPDGAPATVTRPHAPGFPYRSLHYLRRAYARFYRGEPVTPARDWEDIARDRNLVGDVVDMEVSHLLYHADNLGYYVPAGFEGPLFLWDFDRGHDEGMVGSSQGLLRELCRCAPALDIRLDALGPGTGEVDALSDAEAARLYALPPEADFATESIVWLTLYEACRVSIASGHAIAFH